MPSSVRPRSNQPHDTRDSEVVATTKPPPSSGRELTSTMRRAEAKYASPRRSLAQRQRAGEAVLAAG